MNDYVVAAFVVVWFVMMLYVAVVASRTAKISREVELLNRLAERSDAGAAPADESTGGA